MSEAAIQRRFTVEEYHRMGETGILAPGERVELVLGIVRTMSPKNRAHVIATNRCGDCLREKLAGRGRVYKEDPLLVANLESEPEPDIMVCSNTDLGAYGTEAMVPLLVVEVAESSLEYDRSVKARLYAEAGIPEYWIVNLVEAVLERFRIPEKGRYLERMTLEPPAVLTLVAWPDVEIEVGDLLS